MDLFLFHYCRWYPPGHGDFYQSFLDSGLLDMLEERGREYAFISNVDNMAGITDLRILSKIVEEKVDFALEVTKTTQADVKGRVIIGGGCVVVLSRISQTSLTGPHVDCITAISFLSFHQN